MVATATRIAGEFVAQDQAIDTPTMVVDESVMQTNIDEMQSMANSFGVKLRPHIKTHKTPQIALRQIAAGATGITCAKLGEAEVMADGGVQDILIAVTDGLQGMPEALSAVLPATTLQTCILHLIRNSQPSRT